MNIRRAINFIEEYSLNGMGIDKCSEELDRQLNKLGVERQNILRIRFSIEEALLRFRDHFEEKGVFALKIKNRFGKIMIQIVMEGEIYNPLNKADAADNEDWSGSLLTEIGLSPYYSYQGGKNILRLGIPKGGLNPALKVLIAVAIGLIVGFLINITASTFARDYVIKAFLMEIYDFWIRMLTVCSGPVIFFVVCSSVLNSGTIEEEGGNTNRIVTRYFLFSILYAVLAILVSMPMLYSNVIVEGGFLIRIKGYFKAILSIMPSDLATPIMQSNTPQILLLAFVLGKIIVNAGSRANRIRTIVHQGENICFILTEAVSRLVPYFAAILICMEVVMDSMKTFLGMWQIILLAFVTSVIVLFVSVLYVSLKKSVPVSMLLKKIWPSFVTVFKKGSVEAGFGQIESICVDKLGMEKHFTAYSLPYGLVLYMPTNVIGTIMFTIYAAVKFDVSITPGWLLVAIVLSVALFVASPPVPGVNLLAYIMIFAQLGIPSTALVDAMIFDIIFGTFASASNQTLLQLELIMQSDKIGLLDKEVLRG